MDVAKMPSASQQTSTRRVFRDWLLAMLLLIVAVVVAVLLWLHVPGLNGPKYWRWWYRNPSASFVAWFSAGLLPIVVAVIVRPKGAAGHAWAIVTVILAGAMLRAVVVFHLQPSLGLAELDQLVRSEYATSYYYDGVRLLNYAAERKAAGEAPRHWLTYYAEFHPQTSVHTATKPAGGVIYWMAWRAAVGDERAPLVGAIALMALTSLTPLLVWRTAIRLGIVPSTALLAAALMAISPGYLLATPSFDAAYPLFTCGLMLAWLAAVERNSLAAVVVSGVILFLGTLMSLHLLCIGLAVVAAPSLAGRLPWRIVLRRSAALSIGVVIVIVTLYGAMAWAFDYAPVAVIRSSFINQSAWVAANPQWFTPRASLYNLTDGALGVGWPVAVAFAAAVMSTVAWRDSRQLVWVTVVTIALAAGAHMLPAEVARVWIFLTPLVVIPAAARMNQLPERPRAVVVLSACLASLATCATLKFILGSLPAAH